MSILINRAYYSNSIRDFLRDSVEQILGQLVQYHQFALEELQRNAWIDQIQLLQALFQTRPDLSGHIYFEYAIPRMGKRVPAFCYLVISFCS